MSAGDLFTRDLWEAVAGDLRGVSETWWKENEDQLTELGKDEILEIATSLRNGETTEAKLRIAGHMAPEDFAAYVRGTTEQLEGVARRRAELMDALEDLGIRSARMVGRAVLAALIA